MTRVNVVDVANLADQHLFAEWREIKMVPPALRRSLKAQSTQAVIASIPRAYTLNTGHVSFFYDKMQFLAERYALLDAELLNRNYDISSHDPDEIFYQDIPDEFKTQCWTAYQQDLEINVARINLRISEKPDWYRYYGRPIDAAYFYELYKFQIDNTPARC